jgi:hypothetical protein
VAVIVWYTDLQLPVQSVSITSILVSSIPVLGEVYSIQYYVIEVCQWLATGRWFSLGTPVSSNNKTDHHDITDILLKVLLNTRNLKTSPLFLISEKKDPTIIIFWSVSSICIPIILFETFDSGSYICTFVFFTSHKKSGRVKLTLQAQPPPLPISKMMWSHKCLPHVGYTNSHIIGIPSLFSGLSW